MDHREQFLNYMRYERRSSPLTVEAYDNDLRLLVTYLTNNNLGEIDEISSATIRRWIMQLLTDGMAARSVNRKIASTRSYFRYLCRNELLDKNPCTVIENVKTPKKLPVFLHDKEMDLMLDKMNFDDDFEGVRDRTILETFYMTGMRLSELTNLTDNQIDFARQVITVTGKRSKQRIIPITKVLEETLKSYLQRRNKEFGQQSHGRLFLTKKGDPIYTKLVYRLVHKHIETVSTIEKKSPHVIRHTFATVLLNNGADLIAIKELLGHSSLAATQIYAHNDFEQLSKIYKQAHPRAENKED